MERRPGDHAQVDDTPRHDDRQREDELSLVKGRPIEDQGKTPCARARMRTCREMLARPEPAGALDVIGCFWGMIPRRSS